jgi:hypothetical protein
MGQEKQRQGEPVTWDAASRIADTPGVHEALELFSEDPTGDAGTSLVREVLEAGRADPGEVERLESLLRASRTSLDNCALQIEKLQAMLAERDALLKQAVDNEESFNFDNSLIARIKRLLSASAEPAKNPNTPTS